jgi:hypothetical protein
MLAEAKTTDYTKLLSTEAGSRVVNKVVPAVGCPYPVLASKDDG